MIRWLTAGRRIVSVVRAAWEIYERLIGDGSQAANLHSMPAGEQAELLIHTALLTSGVKLSHEEARRAIGRFLLEQNLKELGRRAEALKASMDRLAVKHPTILTPPKP